MNNPVQFTATYKHYQMTASRFTMELDRLTDQADIILVTVRATHLPDAIG